MSDSLQKCLDRGDLGQAWEMAINRCSACFNRGDYDEAQGYAEMALDLSRQVYKAPHINIARSLENRSIVHCELGQRRQAVAMLRSGIQMRTEVSSPTDPELANAMMNLAIMLTEGRKYKEAELLLGQALDIYKRRKRESLIGDAHFNLGRLCARQNLVPKAKMHFEQAIAIYDRTRKAPPTRKAGVRLDLAKLYLSMRRFKAAEALLGEADRLLEKAADYDNAMWISQMLKIIDTRIALAKTRGADFSELETRKAELIDAHDNRFESVWMD